MHTYMRMCHSLRNACHKQTYVFVLILHKMTAYVQNILPSFSFLRFLYVKVLPILQIGRFVTATEETNGDAVKHIYNSLGFSM